MTEKQVTDEKYTVLFEFVHRTRHGSIGYCVSETLPWAVGYNGASHYFRTLSGSVAYCVGRDFIPYHKIDRITAEIKANLKHFTGRPYKPQDE